MTDKLMITNNILLIKIYGLFFFKLGFEVCSTYLYVFILTVGNFYIKSRYFIF